MHAGLLWWKIVDWMGAMFHCCGLASVVILIVAPSGGPRFEPRAVFLAAMEFISLLFHGWYVRPTTWREDQDEPNSAKWLEYSLTAALGVLALLPPTTFKSCDAYAATLVAVVAGGVLQQQAGKKLDEWAYAGVWYDKHKWATRVLFWAACMWQIGEIFLVWNFSGVPTRTSKALMLLPYIVFYPAFGVLCFFRLWSVRPRRYNFIQRTSTSRRSGGVAAPESTQTRFYFETAYSLLGTVAKITLLATTCTDLFADHHAAQWVGMSTTLAGLCVLGIILRAAAAAA